VDTVQRLASGVTGTNLDSCGVSAVGGSVGLRSGSFWVWPGKPDACAVAALVPIIRIILLYVLALPRNAGVDQRYESAPDGRRPVYALHCLDQPTAESACEDSAMNNSGLP
jgi:hypothetical protein